MGGMGGLFDDPEIATLLQVRLSSFVAHSFSVLNFDTTNHVPHNAVKITPSAVLNFCISP